MLLRCPIDLARTIFFQITLCCYGPHGQHHPSPLSWTKINLICGRPPHAKRGEYLATLFSDEAICVCFDGSRVLAMLERPFFPFPMMSWNKDIQTWAAWSRCTCSIKTLFSATKTFRAGFRKVQPNTFQVKKQAKKSSSCKSEAESSFEACKLVDCLYKPRPSCMVKLSKNGDPWAPQQTQTETNLPCQVLTSPVARTAPRDLRRCRSFPLQRGAAANLMGNPSMVPWDLQVVLQLLWTALTFEWTSYQGFVLNR